MNKPASVNVFQMKLAQAKDFRFGWEFADEGDDEHDAPSFSYVVPWRPDVQLENEQARFAGTRRGDYADFPLQFNGNVFIQHETGLRFALNDPLSPQDFRGLPFLRTFPYLGSRKEILEWYGIKEFVAFLPLIPLDLIKMDRLYLDDGIIFSGITTIFGPHVATVLERTEKVSGYSAKISNNLRTRKRRRVYQTDIKTG